MTRSAHLLGAMVALAFAVSSCGGSDSAKSPSHHTTPSPSFYASGVPYVHEGKLYIDHKEQPGTWLDAETGGAYTAATKSGRKHLTMVILRDGRRVETVADLVSGPKFSPDGTKLAWVTLADRDAGTLVVRDLTKFRDLGQLPILVRPNGAEGISVRLDVENDGTAYYELRHKSWAWKPGGTPIRAESPGGADQNPPGFAGIDAGVRLSPDHLWGAWVTNRDPTSLNMQKPGDTGSRFTLPLPAGTGRAGPVQWKSPILVSVFMEKPTADGRQRIVDCDVVTRTCKDASDTYSPP